jgi:hypothetical protein
MGRNDPEGVCRPADPHGAGPTQPGARGPAAAASGASSVAAPGTTPGPDPAQRRLPHLAPSAPRPGRRCAVPSERELAGRRRAAGALEALHVACLQRARRGPSAGSGGRPRHPRNKARAAGALPLTGAAVKRVFSSGGRAPAPRAGRSFLLAEDTAGHRTTGECLAQLASNAIDAAGRGRGVAAIADSADSNVAAGDVVEAEGVGRRQEGQEGWGPRLPAAPPHRTAPHATRRTHH